LWASVVTPAPTIDQNQLFAGVHRLALRPGCGLGLHAGDGARQGRQPEERTVFYFSVGGAVVGAVGIAFTGFTPWSEVDWRDAVWVIPIGVLASLGQWCMTRAYRKGATLVVASMQYSALCSA